MGRRQKPAKECALEAVSEVLCPIASAMLKANLSASALVEAAKQAYLRAAIDSLEAEGKKKVNISRLSVITGMTRKEIAAYLPRKVSAATATSPRKQMEHRALRVLRAWTTDPRYRMATGRTVALPIQGGGKTLESLVRSYGGDVTTIAVLRELERLQAVSRSSSGLLRLKPGCLRAQMRESAKFRDFGRMLADFSGTAGQVFVERESPLYFGSKDIEVTESQAARFKDAFGKRASLLLDGVEHWRSREIRNAGPLRKNSKQPGQRIGVGVYLFEERADLVARRLRNR